MDKNGLDDVLLTGGGIIPVQDINALKKLGIGELFTPGATTTAIAVYIKDWVKKHHRN